MKKATDADILAQISAARGREADDRRTGLRATAVRYDPLVRRFLLDLTNGYQLGVPVAVLPAVADASERQLGEVALSPEGGAFRVSALDADFSVPGVVLDFASTVLGESRQ